MAQTKDKLITAESLKYVHDKLESEIDNINAPDFNSNESYTAGQYVTHENNVYQFTQAHTGAWDASHVVQTDLISELSKANDSKSNTFYGLASAAGDATQASSNNPVGTYTDSAKQAIQSMLGMGTVENVSGATPTITGVSGTHYVCGELTSLSITPPQVGTIDVLFTSGATATTLTLPNTVIMPDWFDATALETGTIYEIMITNGTYGMVMTWQA